MRILVSGGAGFIGSHLVDALLKRGYQVRVYDNLEEQVHQGKYPTYLNKEVEYIWEDIRNSDALAKALKDVEVVFHFASMVGVGQSQYQIRKYIDVNAGGTATLWDLIINHPNKVKKVIVSASMSSYGEGLCSCKNCGKIKPTLREESQLEKKIWELYCPKCKSKLCSLPTDEETPLEGNSIYALGKKYQEEISLLLGKLYRIPVVALRFFNVYGSRQALSNPYTGVCAIFIARIKNAKPPLVFEDGNQTRDFISVKDVVEACILCLEKEKADYQIFNVGSGKATSIREIAELLAKLLKKDLTAQIPGWYRKGDIRACYANIDKIKNLLGWEPKVELSQGLRELIEWAEGEPSFDKFDLAFQELMEKNLVKT